MLGRRSRWIAAVVVLMLAPPPAMGAPVLEHLHWTREDRVWLTAGGVIDANDDATPDIVVAGGDRDSSYVQCLVPPAMPWPKLHEVKDQILLNAAKMAALDGRTGEPIWEVIWAPGGTAADPPPERTHHHFIHDVLTGDLDGDGAGDLIVLRMTRAADGSSIDQHITSYDPRTGAVEWQVTEAAPADAPLILGFLPVDLDGTPAALVSKTIVRFGFGSGGVEVTTDAEARLVRLEPGGPPRHVTHLPDGLVAPLVVPSEDGARILAFPLRLGGTPGNIAVDIDVRAVDVVRDEQTDEYRATQAWSRARAGGSPMHVTGGSDPALLVGRLVGQRTSNIAAIDLEDGNDRWVSPVDVGPLGGSFIAAEVNGDGVHDVIASPAFGHDATGAFTGGPFAELHALDGRTGQPLWTKTDPLGKFRVWSLDLLDIDGDGDHEVAGALANQDGFPLCSAPADDTSAVGVWDVATGQQLCRLPTDRFAAELLHAPLDGTAGDEIVAPTLGGTTYAFRNAQPGCGVLGTNPLP